MVVKNGIQEKRQAKGLLYRIGPSSIEDEKNLPGSTKFDEDLPKGLNEFLAYSTDNINHEKNIAGSEVLIVYFAKVGLSSKGVADLDYVQTLINAGADVNFTDRHGQTVLHEVALRWPIRVADFLFKNGANINAADEFGRTPLHVAASVDYPDMIEYLVHNGANIDARTYMENQTPIHYAAKYNAGDAINCLVELDARLDDRDHKERTPLQLAAETGRENSCRALLDLEAPCGVYDDTGTPCLTHMIEKMPDVAAIALNQFQKVDKSSRTVYYYLSYLETQKWKLLRTNKLKGSRLVETMDPLDAIIKYNESILIMHPVIQRLLAKKLEMYGRTYFLTNLFINFIFTLIWTALTVTLPGPETVEPVVNAERPCNTTCRIEFYTPLKDNLWRIVMEILGLLMAFAFVLKIRFDSGISLQNFHNYKHSRIQELKRDLPYCHPRWPQEEKHIRSEISRIDSEPLGSIYDVWYYLDVISFLGLVFLTITRVLLVELDPNSQSYLDTLSAHYHGYAFILIIIWLRFMQAFRPFITLGPFIAMLGYVASDTLKFAFIFCEFFIPYCCSIWIVFGGEEDSGIFKNFNDLVFEVWRMTLTDSFRFDDLTSQNKLVAQILCGTYLAITAITCMNLYIALLSETFARVFDNATATAYMLQGEALINVAKRMSRKRQDTIKNYVAEECSPEAVYGTTFVDDQGGSARGMDSEMQELRRQLEILKKLQEEIKAKSSFLRREGVRTIERQSLFMNEMQTCLNILAEN